MKRHVALFSRGWGSNDESGHPQIDAQHRGLLESMRQVEFAIEARKDASFVYTMLADVVRACIEHFQHEEVVLDAIGYPRLHHHRREHLELAEKMSSRLRQHSSGDLATMEMLTALFYEPLVLHMVRDDRAYFSYLKMR